MKTLHIFYDGDCGLCRACRGWLKRQPAYVALNFLPYQSDAAREVCPILDELHPGDKIVAMSDEGGIYIGEDAWIMCLWALLEYRELAIRFSAPALKPLAGKFCRLVSDRRYTLSKLVSKKRYRNPDELAKAVRWMPDPPEAKVCWRDYELDQPGGNGQPKAEVGPPPLPEK